MKTTRILVLGLLMLSLATAAAASCITLEILTETIPMGFVGESYSAQFDAWGGTPGYTWSIYSGSLPPGVTLSSSGQLSGTPTTAGFWTVCVRVTDSAGCHRTQCFEFYVE